MRRYTAVVIMAMFLLLASIMAGCGTLDINLHTTVERSGDFIQQIRFEADGPIASLLEEPEFTADFEKDGWKMTAERSEDSVTIVVTRRFSSEEVATLPEMAAGPTTPEVFSPRVEGGFFATDYLLEVTLPGNPDVADEFAEDESAEFGEFAKQMLEGMFNISWTITLPGKIVESNADVIEGGSATWNFNLFSSESDQHLTVHSRYINWPAIGGIIAAVVVVVVLVIFLLVRRKAAGAPFGSEVIEVEEDKEGSV